MIWTKSRISELGLSVVGCDPIDSITRFQRMPENEKKADLRDAGLMKSRYVDYSCQASLDFLLNGDHANARKWANTAIDAGETYFFGEWRDIAPSGNDHKQPPSREFQDIYQLWMDYYEWTMCLVAALDRWGEFERCATYPRDDVLLDPDHSEAHRAWWLYFCGIVRKRPAKEIATFRQAVFDAKRAKTDQLLLTWVDALFNGTDEQLSDAMKAYFQHHRKAEVKKPGLRLAIRGSMLLHYGVHLGRDVAPPPNTDLYIVEFAQ